MSSLSFSTVALSVVVVAVYAYTIVGISESTDAWIVSEGSCSNLAIMGVNFERSEYQFLRELGIWRNNLGCYGNGVWKGNGSSMTSVNPVDNQRIATVVEASIEDYEDSVRACAAACKIWMQTPAPKSGEIVRQIGEALCAKLNLLVGLSRQLNGSIIPSERPNHMMMEVWNPLGIVGVITTFNFPCVVLGWNACIALVCGNCVVWKGAPTTPLITIATTKLIVEVLEKNGLPGAIFTCICGGAEIGQAIAKDTRIPLVSFIGSTRVGQIVQKTMNERFGKCLLELSGNNAIIVMDDADLALAVRSVLFVVVGTAGQRCTTCCRLLLHEKIYQYVINQLANANKQVKVGDPLDKNTLLGPLHTHASKVNFERGIEAIKS